MERLTLLLCMTCLSVFSPASGEDDTRTTSTVSAQSPPSPNAPVRSWDPFSPTSRAAPNLEIRNPATPEETKTLSGRITDQSGAPITGVKVRLFNHRYSTRTLGQEAVTDSKGKYQFEPLRLWKNSSGPSEYFYEMRFEHSK